MNAISKLLAIFTAQIQALEDAYRQLLTERSVDTAVGAQLDAIGKLVGQEREGLDDDAYRRLVRARISVNKSSGLAEQILQIAILVVNDPSAYFRLQSHGNASATLTIASTTLDYQVASLLMGFLRSAVAAGVRLVLEFSGLAASATFAFDPSGGGTVGKGWGDTTDPTKGGGWASAFE